MGKINYTYRLDLSATQNAFPYQQEAFEAVKDLDYSAIFHEQGLGKTKIAIDLLLYWLEKRDIDTVMIVTKKQLVRNWENEFAFHTHIKPQTMSSNKADNFFVLNSPCRVIITNFETIAGEEERLSLFLKARNTAIIIDESTKIKNPDAKLTLSFFRLAPLFKVRTIMTGTPVANRPYDIWAQIYFLDFGQSLGEDFNKFKTNTNLTNSMADNSNERKVFEDEVASIFEKIKGFTVRETKNSGVISLPNKEFFNIYCSFEPKQEALYNKIKNEMMAFVQQKGEAVLDDSEACLKRLLRLVQVASNPRLVDELYGSFSGKEIKLRELVSAIMERDEKVIIWSSFIENAEYFSKIYKQYSPVKIHGRMAIEDRNKSVERFKFGDAKILFATPQAAKEGLTLTVANNVVFYDRGFNLDDYLQAQDRIHRISQQKTCNIYNLMMEDSVDIWVDKLLQAKQNAAFLAQGDYKLAKYQSVMDYTYGDLIKEILNIENT